MSALRVGSLNLPARTNAAGKRVAVDRVTTARDVVGFQEGAHLTSLLKGTGGWDFHQPEGSGLEALPIAWNTRTCEFRGALYEQHYERTYVGSWGAGPPWMTPGWTHGVLLFHKPTDEEFWFFNNHLVPSASKKRPLRKEARKGWEKRRELYLLEVAGLAAIVAAQTKAVVSVGDFNARPSFNLLNPLDGMRVVSRPTHGLRPIDHVRFRDAKVAGHPRPLPLKATKVRTIDTASDHRALVVDLARK